MRNKKHLIHYKNETHLNINDPGQIYYLEIQWCFSNRQIREAVKKTGSTELIILHEFLQNEKASLPDGGRTIHIAEFVHKRTRVFTD